MLDVEIRTMVTFNSEEDLTKLKCTKNTIEELIDLFSKSGNGCGEEMYLLKGSSRIIDKILKNETF